MIINVLSWSVAIFNPRVVVKAISDDHDRANWEQPPLTMQENLISKSSYKRVVFRDNGYKSLLNTTLKGNVVASELKHVPFS